MSDRLSESTIRKFDFSLTRQILLLTFPLALSRQMENGVRMVDIFMVGKLGPEAISAVGISRAVTMVIDVSMNAVNTGAFALVAQSIGAGSMRDASAAAKQAFTLLFFLGIGLGLLGILTAPFLLRALSIGPEVVALGAAYLRVSFLAMPLSILMYALNTCMHGSGDTRTPFYISILAGAVKVAATYCLIFGLWGLPRLGVVGASAGDLIGHVCGVFVGFVVLYSGRSGLTLLPGTSYRPDRNLALRMLKIGIPSGIQGLFRNGSSLVFVKLIALTTNSTIALAAFSIGHQFERAVRFTSLAFGTVATTLVGQSLGAKDPNGAERRGWTVIAIAALALTLLGLPVALFARSIIGFFTDAPRVIGIGAVYLYAVVLAEPFMCASVTSGGSLRGAGDNMPALVYTLVAQWFIRLPVAYILAFTLGYDIYGVWASLVIFCVIQGALSVRKFAQGKWKTRRI